MSTHVPTNSGRAAWDTRLDRLAPAVGFVLSALILFPGFLSSDSMTQLHQARTLDFGDWHPPLMTAIWAVTDRLVSGPFPMLLLQLALIWSGTFLVLRTTGSTARRRGVFSVAFVFFPPVFVILGAIWKDVVLAGWLLLAFGIVRQLLRRSDTEERSGPALPAAALVCLLIAAALRHNGIGAVVGPLALLTWACFFARRPSLRGLILSVVVAVSAAVALSAAAIGINRALAVRHQHIWTCLALHDVLGIAVLSADAELVAHLRRSPLDAIFERPPTLDTLAASYRPGWWSSYIDDGLMVDMVNRGANAEERAALADLWLAAVTGHSDRYFEHRWRAFQALLMKGAGIVYMSPLPQYWNEVEVRDDLVHRYRLSPLQWRVRNGLKHVVARTPIALPALWLGAVPFVLAWAIARFRADPLPTFLLASGVGYQATYLVLGVADDYRYSHWLIASVWMTVLLLVEVELSRRRQSVVAAPGSRRDEPAPRR